jgi:polysaccharide chain length determinant protein (PEP-CTERM system associated)
MLGHREMTMQDYASILKRRFRLILAITVAVTAASMVISRIIPAQYVSQTLVLIEQQKVPENYVKPVVNEDLGARLASMKEQILSRSRIEPIIEQFNLFAGGKNTMDDRVDLTRKAIGINPIRSSEQSRGMPGFFISFKAQDARTAQQVCSEITSLFVSANLSERQESAQGTTDFLKQQLADSKRNLDDQDAKLAAFQSKYIGKLPEQEASNTQTLTALTTQLDAATQAVNRAQQEETFLQTMIAQQPKELTPTEQAAGGQTEDSLQTQLKDAITQKKELDALYTPDHPDVIAISRKIANLREEIAHEASVKPETKPSAAASAARPDTPQVQQLKAQLHATQQSLSAAKQEQARIGGQVRNYEERIEASPMVEQEYKQVTRDHETALQFYNALLTKMNESTMATDLERRLQGEQFTVMDAANLPEQPTFPNRYIFAGGGVAGGLILGLLIVALLEFRDTSLRNERDVWAFTKLPTLAIISEIDALAHLKKPAKPRKSSPKMPKPLESVRG